MLNMREHIHTPTLFEMAATYWCGQQEQAQEQADAPEDFGAYTGDTDVFYGFHPIARVTPQ